MRPARLGEAGAEAVAWVAAPELANGWAKPAPPHAEGWREPAFEIVLDSVGRTGVFERVVVERDGSERSGRATVFDFKTERVERGGDLGAAVAQPTGQWELYRSVVAWLGGMGPAPVACAGGFTRLRRRVAVTF